MWPSVTPFEQIANYTPSSRTGTLILDEDGLHDPATFNDRLLLGLKGTMSSDSG
jgi:hypothetical protein